VSRRTAAVLLVVLTPAVTAIPIYLRAQQAQPTASTQKDDLVRRAKNRVEPAYPDLARRMNLSGIVKIEVTVAPNGTVKAARVMGGHPVLAGAALEAAWKWRFEPSPGETSGVIDFKFEPR
jgi:TonB family protein